MSQATVYHSTFAARKGATLRCGKCGQPIAKGEGYRWYKVGFRSPFKNIRCDRHTCDPRPSELESSKLAGVYEAIESAEDNINGTTPDSPDWDSSVEAIRESLSTAADDIRAVADEYREAAEAMGGAGYDMEEKADEVEEAASQLDDWSPDDDEPQPCDQHDEYDSTCEECESNVADWWSEVQASAVSALSDLSF